MNEKLFGKILIVLMSLSLLCAVALPAVRNGAAFRPWVISLPIGIVAVSAYLAFRKSRKRVTPMSTIAFLWMILCIPLLIVVSTVLADYRFRHDDTYRTAIDLARNSEICKDELGPAWKAGWPIEGESRLENGEGHSSLKIPLVSNQQKGWLRVKATKTGGIWKIDALTLQLANGQVEQILNAAPTPQAATADKVQAVPASPSHQTATEIGKNEGIRGFLGPVGLILIYAPLSPFVLVSAIFYILTLQRAVMKCAPESRDFDNPFLWRSFIPIIGLIFHFFVVLGMAKSFRKEFERRGMSGVDPDSGRSLGIAMCLCIPGAIPVLGLLLRLRAWCCGSCIGRELRGSRGN